MPRLRSSEHAQLNFDGLTDSVTNLTGTLVLLVLLLIGVTQRNVAPWPGPSAPAEENTDPGRQSADALLQQSSLMIEQLRRDEQLLGTVEGEASSLAEEVRRLTADKASPPDV
jgi:hypothetical protein